MVRHGTGEYEGHLVVFMVGRISFFLNAIFLVELDRILGYAAARTADVLLCATAEHASGVLIADNPRLDLFMDTTAIRGRRTAGSDVLWWGESGMHKCVRLVERRWGISDAVVIFRI
ncbi:hypothetical protein J19TS1_43180 [Heyndrickxia oleronia]|nr:hypothetical protein J19TS1_43180 [Heyndrickxia oleronia]